MCVEGLAENVDDSRDVQLAQACAKIRHAARHVDIHRTRRVRATSGCSTVFGRAGGREVRDRARKRRERMRPSDFLALAYMVRRRRLDGLV